jgi:rhodanese-related sulfurtransferase/rubrerythrin
MDTDEAKVYMAGHKEDTFTILDVRQPGEYENARIPGAKLIPLPELSDRLSELDPEKPTIAYCAVGGRSRVAAQLLAGQGFDEVYNLKGGIRAWHGLTAAGPSETGMALLRGDETPAEIIVLAYGMEDGLGGFYSAMASKTDDHEISAMFMKLSSIEDRHKEKLVKLYVGIDPSVPDAQTFETKVVADAMEGGLTTEEFLAQNMPAMHTVSDILDMAMMIETQALDLYLRYSHEITDEEGKAVLYDLAEEEKAHLKALGRLMEARL